jgi:hypothetical protein
MTLQDIIYDIHALTQRVESYERKFGVLSETFYESYLSGEEPADDAWVLDWAGWAGSYKILLRRRDQYRQAIEAMKGDTQELMSVIERTARHEPIPIPA